MKKAVIILLLGAFFSAAAAEAKVVIEEGFVFDGIAGVLSKESDVDVWTFRADEKVIMDNGTLQAKTPLRLLPSAVLEQVTGLAAETGSIAIQLRAIATRYKGFNYLYALSFVPLSDSTEPQTKQADESEKPQVPEESIIPEDILKQIKSNKTPDLKRFEEVAKVTGDRNLISRAGYLLEKENVKVFQHSAFGHNVGKNSYILLPNSTLEAAEKQMRQSPGRERFEVSGLVTVYKGRQYMLLWRTRRTYSNGNFTP